MRLLHCGFPLPIPPPQGGREGWGCGRDVALQNLRSDYENGRAIINWN